MSATTQTIKFPCPSCSQNLSAGPDLFGHALHCPNCGVVIGVPMPSAKRVPAKTEVLPTDAASPPMDSSVESGHAGPRTRSAREAFNKYAAGFLSICFVIGAIHSLTSGSGKDQSAGARSGDTLPSPSNAERVENITHQITSQALKSPSTASFTDFRVIDQNGSYFQTYIGVDAQNGFGAIVRSYFVCAFKLEDGGRFSTHKMTAAIEVGSFDHRMFDGPSDPEREQMDFQKHCLGWPGYESKDDTEDGEVGSSGIGDKGHPEQEP